MHKIRYEIGLAKSTQIRRGVSENGLVEKGPAWIIDGKDSPEMQSSCM